MTAHLGRLQDRRLHAGGIRLPERLLGVGQRGVRVRRLGGDRANEMKIRRFLHDPAVTPKEMIETAQAIPPGWLADSELGRPINTRADHFRNLCIG